MKKTYFLFLILSLTPLLNSCIESGGVAPTFTSSSSGDGQIVVGTSHTCYLSPSAEVNCWGSGSAGQLGYGNSTSIGDNETPASAGTITLSGTPTQITAGAYHTCALLSDGTVNCWGAGGAGRLGYGNTNNIGDNETPASAGTVDVGGTVTQISAGGFHTCALLSTGNVTCWGDSSFGQLGYGNAATIGDNETPASAGTVSLGGTVTQIAAGYEHTCALMSDGTVKCWGRASNGQLGYANTNDIGDTELPSSIGTVDIGGTATKISVGSAQTCALLTTGGLVCWGYGDGGRLGYGNTNSIGDDENPSAAGTVTVGETFTDFIVSGFHTCVILTNSNVKCFGAGIDGQLGYANSNNIGDDEVPSTVGEVSLPSTVVSLSENNTDARHTCAILTTGDVSCWGGNYTGQLGYGNTTNIGDNELPSTAGTVSLP